MNVIPFHPTYRANGKGREIDSETMAAVLAKYSRDGGGLQNILQKLLLMPKDKFDRSVWDAFDYGQASIGGLTGGIPVGIDRVPMALPLLCFFLQSKLDGQETSTRYVEFKPEGLESPASFGIPSRFHERWYETMLNLFSINAELTTRLNDIGTQNPELARIPKTASEKVQQRMIRNFGFDRTRYLLPMAGLTNFGLIMTARDWAQTIQYLDSFDLPCSKTLAEKLREGLGEITPRLAKHTLSSARTISFADDFLHRGAEYLLQNGINTSMLPDELIIDIRQPQPSPFMPLKLTENQLVDLAFRGKTNRYDFAKGLPEATSISVYWNNMALAEIRDVNRHRPPKKDLFLAPMGFYMPELSVQEMKKGDGQLYIKYQRALEQRTQLMNEILQSETPTAYVGCLLLGDQMPFELHTTIDQLTYITELRTGVGSHFRYDDHFRQVHTQIARKNPNIAKHIKLGTGEPE